MATDLVTRLRKHADLYPQTYDSSGNYHKCDGAVLCLSAVREIEKLRAELARLQGIVAQCDSTADGVPVFLYVEYTGLLAPSPLRERGAPHTGKAVAIEIVDNLTYVTLEDEDGRRESFTPGETYSTRAAAEAEGMT